MNPQGFENAPPFLNQHAMRTVFLSLLFTLQTASLMYAQTQIVAHRGFWDCEGSAQNSIAALTRAQDEKLFGSELDIIITSDGTAVVHHDDRINGLRIDDTPYHKIKDCKIANGETLPTLEDYLKQASKDKSVKLILEIKPHSTINKEDCAVLIVAGLVEKYRMQKQVEYISFSLNICRKIKEIEPKAKVSYLEGNLSPENVKRAGLDGIDYHFSLFKLHPDWINRAHRLGLTVNAWTVNRTEDMKQLINGGADYITTDNPLLLKDILNQLNDKTK